MGVGSAFLKILSGLLQSIFSIIALGLVIYGAFSAYLIFISNSEEVMKSYGTAIPALLTIVFGFLLLVFVFVGCCGLCRESTCCMETYSAFLILLALAHLALGTYTYVYFNKLETNIGIKIGTEADLYQRVRTYTRNSQEIDLIQSWFSCCGASNYRDEYKYFNDGNELPNSCCEKELGCSKNSDDLNKDGCADNVYTVTIATNILLGWMSLAVGAIELIAALLGLCLSCCIWRNRSASWR